MAPPERAAVGPPVPRRRLRLARGPLTIGEPAPAIEPRLAAGEPYRPDTIADGGSAFGLTVRAASVRGLNKRYLGGPRQDDLCLAMHSATSTLIAAVADGVSAAPRSDLGAALAVRYATAAVARQLDDGEIDWPGAFEQAAWALVSEGRRIGEDPGSLATTLVVAAVSVGDGDPDADADPDAGADPDADAVTVQVAAVGDSPAFRLHRRTYDPVVDSRASEDGLIGGGVAALPRDAREMLVGSCTLGPRDALLLCSDGVALPLAGGEGELGRTLARELGTPPDVVDFARLLDFSRSTYDDDRTLIAVWAPRTR